MNPPSPSVLILDGIFGRVSRFEGLRKKLEREGLDVRLWKYTSNATIGLDDLGKELAKEIRLADGPVNLIAFSMGGLVVRSALFHEADLPVQKVVFLNSPHQGSLLAWGLPLPAARDLRPGSEFLNKLMQQAWRPETMAIWCPGDLIVLPGCNARWSQADVSITSWTPAHIWPIYSSSLHQKIIAFIGSEQ